MEFTSNPCSQLPFLTFHGQDNRQGNRRADNMSALRYPTFPPQRYHSPPHLPLIHHQGNIHAAPCHPTSSCAAEGMFSLRFAEYFLRSITLFLLCYCCDLSWSYHPFEEVTLKVYDLEHDRGRFEAASRV